MGKLLVILAEHGDTECFIIEDGAIEQLDGIRYAELKPQRETYNYPPKDGIRKGVFFTEYEDENP